MQLIEHTMVTSFNVSFNEPREGKLGGFSYLESLKNLEDSRLDFFRKFVSPKPEKV